MVWVGYEIVISFTGWPRAAGPILGAVIGATVFCDPMGWIWPRDADPSRAATNGALNVEQASSAS